MGGAVQAIADDGTIVVSWADYEGKYAAVRPPGGAFSSRVLVSNVHPEAAAPMSGVPGGGSLR